MLSSLKRLIIGRPLRTEQLQEEKLPVWKALPILSSDALSSVAYGTEQILTVLAPIGALALWYSLPISGAIIGLLTLLILSYRQIIHEYPGGGGAYIVSTDNLGWFAGLIAGASLLIDYTLTVAVSVSAGTDAITSAFPVLHKHSTLISVFFVLLIMLLNLRGLRESGTIFSFPTYLFILGMLGLVLVGLGNVAVHGIPANVPPVTHTFPAGLGWFLLLRAFSSGCSALTGVEAISNATPTFRKPETKNAARTLALLGLLLAMLFGGTSLLAYLYHITPSPTETVLSQIAEETFGRTLPYYYIQGTTALILILAANTAFAGFPLLASIMAKDKFMPRMFASRGDRLNYSNGIIVLALAAIGLIVAFEGEVERLIPLYAIGVFLSFTLSQTGMVVRRWKQRNPGWMRKIAINAAGAVVSFIVLLIFAVTKFTEGAWIVVLVIPLFIFAFYQVRKHYEAVAEELRIDITADKPEKKDHVIIIPVGGISRVVRNTIAYAKTIGDDIVAIHVAFTEEDADKMEKKWEQWNPGVRLVVTRSRYRSVNGPVLRFIDLVQERVGDNLITVLIPEFIPRRWWQRFLHNQSALWLRFLLLLRKDVIVSTVPFHLRK
ncbi:amino acid permease [Polycladomyces abyssicola]|uniref:Amino acid permease n=1 Tax=Polycladomyces abyssicola TaxID=1125966 RepID=A0A8D5ZPL0_9BACL|nr:APC family permease [Polycladomyces abyssicola]BCU82458.1 amino acid permease [Polycladomyces abyssicola]